VGEKSFSVTAVRDLTEQRRAEEFRRILFEQAGEAILVVDMSTRRIVDANDRACELHGYSREEFLSSASRISWRRWTITGLKPSAAL
jgi:PAS domain-containing protein